MLNYRLLAACISIVVGSILYFFYWSRFIALLLGFLFRVSFWNQKASSVWLEIGEYHEYTTEWDLTGLIGSIHFSLLAGRILLKDVRYHSSNQTVKIVKAQIVWSYWIRKPTTEEDLSNARVGGEDRLCPLLLSCGHGHNLIRNCSLPDKHSRGPQSCRIQVSFQGFEWFMYNRTAAYDNIASAMDPQAAAARSDSHRPSEDATAPHRTPTKSSGFAGACPIQSSLEEFGPSWFLTITASSVRPPSFVPGPPQLVRSAYTWLKQQLPSLDPKDLLPVGIEATKGAIVCGNGSTPSLLVAEFKKAECTFGIVQARSKLDFYKQILSFKFQGALIQFVENEEFQNPMTTTGRLVQEHIEVSRSVLCDTHLPS